MTLFGIVFGAVLLIVVVGEWLGMFESLTDRHGCCGRMWPARTWWNIILATARL